MNIKTRLVRVTILQQDLPKAIGWYLKNLKSFFCIQT